MLTEVKAYSALQSAPTLLLTENGRPENDLIQIANVDGLDPVKASVNTSPRGSVDGASYTGSSVPSRNIVLTVRLNPDWGTWTYESLRRLLYSYFMPKRAIRLVFESDDLVPVEIYGVVEDVSINQFSKDPEFLISVICPDPYFTAVTATVITGQTVRPGGATVVVPYEGNVETGLKAKVTYVSGISPTEIGIQLGNSQVSYFTVDASVDAMLYFEMNSLPMQKFVQNINMSSGLIENLLTDVQDGSSWPILWPGDNVFSVVTDQGVQDWELTFFEKFGGL